MDDDPQPSPSLISRLTGALRGSFAKSPPSPRPDPIAEAAEKEIMANVRLLRDRVVQDIMVPRAAIIAIDVGIAHEALMETIHNHKHSRMPVYQDTLDEVIGMIHIKDVLPRVGAAFPIREITREILIVAPSQTVLDLLHQMRDERVHMAVIVDEHGAVDGLVTIEDLVECIVGEIVDEHEDRAPALIPCPDGSYLADARMELEEVQRELSMNLPEKDLQEVDTIGGLVVTIAQRIPRRGEVISLPGGFQIELVDVGPRRIKTVRLRRVA
ncbi:MAG: hemolysin family protein [Pseudomonadota bacterium]